LTGLVADRLQQLLGESAVQNGFEVLACEVMPDHVHIFVSAPPQYSPADPSTELRTGLAKLFKGVTSRRLRQELSEQVRRKVWKPGTLWSPSYYVGSAGNPSTSPSTPLRARLRTSSSDGIRRYIEECPPI
jgi:putative transposase